MSTLAPRTLGDLVSEAPSRAMVFERLGLDYCCHGRDTLADACHEAGLDVNEVTALIADTGAPAQRDAPLEPVALADHIEDTHHRYLHVELPELSELADKVADVHGERHPELATVRDLVSELRTDLEPHLSREEHILFPAIRALAGGRAALPFGTIANPITVMGLEHDRAGELLAALRASTAGYQAPEDGCASYQSLYQRLARLEADTHRHIHLENNVLFPAALALEDA